MDAQALIEELQPVFRGMARKFSKDGDPFLDVEDLVQDQILQTLQELAKGLELSDRELKSYVFVSCRSRLLELVRSSKAKRRSAPVVSLEVKTVSGEPVAFFVSDGSWEKKRLQMEQQERRALLSAVDRCILEEFETPGKRTLEAYRSDVKARAEQKASVKGVRIHDRMQPRHVAKGLGLPVRRVYKAMESIRSVYGL